MRKVFGFIALTVLAFQAVPAMAKDKPKSEVTSACAAKAESRRNLGMSAGNVSNSLFICRERPAKKQK